MCSGLKFWLGFNQAGSLAGGECDRRRLAGTGLGFLALGLGIPEAVALADDADYHRVVQAAVEDGGGGRHVLEQLAPVLGRAGCWS